MQFLSQALKKNLFEVDDRHFLTAIQTNYIGVGDMWGIRETRMGSKKTQFQLVMSKFKA